MRIASVKTIATFIFAASTFLVGCAEDIPSAAAISCSELRAERDAEREKRLVSYSKALDDLDYRHAQVRGTGSAGHFSDRKKLKDQLFTDLQLLDTKFQTRCAQIGQ